MSMSLAYAIRQLINDVNSNADADRDIPVNEQRIFAARLMALGRLAHNIEQELTVLRLVEAGREGRSMVDQLASDQFENLVRDPDGKVVRPDFGKGTRP